MKRLNCWEFKECGRQPEGDNVADLGLCPAAIESSMDGVHEGKNAGRACWTVAGTMCRGEVQGSFALENENCIVCDFYRKVIKEEGNNYQYPVMIQKMIRKQSFFL